MIPLRTAAAIACALIALPAAAQDWRIELSNPTLTPAAPSTDIILSVYVPEPEIFATTDWSTHASERGWDETSFESLATWPGQRPGELSPDGRSVVGQFAQQLWAFGPPLTNPTYVWRGTFTATEFSAREITISTETDLFEVFVPGAPGSPPDVEPRTPIEGRAVIQVIPAPGTLALLGVSAMLASRRRRPGDTIIPTTRKGVDN